jgi:thiol-disulfide isomerase/thioredoxin
MNSRFCSPGKLLPYLFYLLLSYVLMMCWRPVSAQTVKGPVRQIAIGDTVPDLIISNILNYKSPTAKLTDFKGKLLILDFWATWCQPCVAMIPRMDSLEKRFGDKVTLLPVTYQTEKEVSLFRAKYNARKGARIQGPEVVADSKLSKLFEHSGVPHYVWIDSDGVLRAVTGKEEITAERLEAFLSGNARQMAIKKDVKDLAYNGLTTPLHKLLQPDANPAFKNVRYRALHSGYVEGLPGLTVLKQPGDSIDHWRVTFTNITPFHLFSMAYGEGKRFIAPHSVDLQTRDSLKFINGLKGAAVREWIPKNTMCYELIIPAEKASGGFKMFRDDLKQLFPEYEALIETRTMPVLALVRTSELEKFKSKSERFSEKYENFTYSLRHGKLSVFAMGLENSYMRSSKLPIVDQTGYVGRADLDLDLDFNDLASVRKALSAYDLALERKLTETQVLVIRDRKPLSVIPTH